MDPPESWPIATTRHAMYNSKNPPPPLHMRRAMCRPHMHTEHHVRCRHIDRAPHMCADTSTERHTCGAYTVHHAAPHVWCVHSPPRRATRQAARARARRRSEHACTQRWVCAGCGAPVAGDETGVARAAHPVLALVDEVGGHTLEDGQLADLAGREAVRGAPEQRTQRRHSGGRETAWRRIGRGGGG
jgi:hypothetical protein